MACSGEVTKPTDSSMNKDENRLTLGKRKKEVSRDILKHRSNLFELSKEIQKLNEQRLEIEEDMQSSKGLKYDPSEQIKRLNEQRSILEHELVGTKGLTKVELSMQIQKLNEERSKFEGEMEIITDFKNKIANIEKEIEGKEGKLAVIENQIERKEAEKEEIVNRLSTLTHEDKDTETYVPEKIELFFQRLNLENEMVIEGMFPENFACEVVPWDSSKDRLSITKDNSCPKNFSFETDIFNIKEAGTIFPLSEINTPCTNMLLSVMLPNLNTKDTEYLHYIGASMYQNAWQFIEPISQEGNLIFAVTQVESFCVISIVPGQNYIIPEDGGTFISTIDSRIQVCFPPGAVKTKTVISFKVHPRSITCIKEVSEEENIGAGPVCKISPGLSANHLKFRRPVVVKLPLEETSEHSYDHKKYKCCVFTMEDEGFFEMVPNVIPKIEDEIASFEIITFSRYVAAVVKKSVDQKQRGSIIDRAQGIKKRCKILFFVGNTEKSHIHILLECVEWDKVKEITKRRQSLGFHLISDWISKDLYLEPYNTVLVVEMKGKFKIPKESGFKQRKITFLPLAQDNYEHIVAELDDKKMSAHGIVSIFQNNQLLYEIFYDPVRSIKVAPICPKPNLKKAHLKHVKCLDEAEFFTDIGLLELAKLMDDNTMFQVCIYMKMSKDTYDSIHKQSSIFNKFTLLQTALKEQTNGKKVKCLTKALASAGEKHLAERVQNIWSAGQPLRTISGK